MVDNLVATPTVDVVTLGYEHRTGFPKCIDGQKYYHQRKQVAGGGNDGTDYKNDHYGIAARAAEKASGVWQLKKQKTRK